MSDLTLNDQEMVDWANANLDRVAELEAAIKDRDERIAKIETLQHDFALAESLLDETRSDLYRAHDEIERLERRLEVYDSTGKHRMPESVTEKDWDDIIEAPLPLSSRGHVSVVINLANGRKVSGIKWNQIVGARIQKGADHHPVALPAKLLEVVRHNMSMVAEGTIKEREAAARAIAGQVGNNILIAPTWSIERGRSDRVIARNAGSAIVYGLWLLTDKQSELNGMLCRCQYSECRKFFLKRPGKGGRGANVRKHCCRKHGVLADQEQARSRMSRIRQKRRSP